ncbi:MAG: RnfABCDGE type electron transport complex subunit G [Thermoanaerobacteraceae bacterium]|nr:RnfABCDGE type electron transport complex subunit G [Thermoanaerobacteraceae bacterium]
MPKNGGVKDIIVTGLILLLIAGVAGVALGYVNAITKGPIAEQNKIAEDQAKMAAFPEAKEFAPMDASEWEPLLEGEEKEIVKTVDMAKDNGNVLGFVIKVAPQGYGGPVETIVGITKDGKLTGINIVNHSETPGLGAKAQDPEWQGQFKGKTADMELKLVKRPVSSPEEVEALTGATITSTAVTNGVQTAIETFKKINK